MLYDLGSRARSVYDVLRERIRSGDLAPGTRLPPHTALAATFGVAPLTVRQVLARLEADRLLVRERGRGTFVRAAEGPQILIVAADPAQRTDLAGQVRAAERHAVLAATPAEGLAALDREPLLVLAVVDLHLPGARDGLTFVRRLRHRQPDLPIAILNPTRRQRSRLQDTVAPPLLSVGDPPLGPLARVLRADVPGAPPGLLTRAAGLAQRLEELVKRYVAVQLNGDRVAAQALLLHDPRVAGLSVADLYTHVLQAAQYRLGDLWQCNAISVAREHLATAVTEAVLFDVAAAAPRAPGSGMAVLVACVEGERHDIGARMVAQLLELDGFAVRFLGADVPTDSLLALLRQEPPRLLVLSAARPERLGQLRAAVARVRQAHGAGLPIFVGGQVLDWAPDAVRALEVDLAAQDARETLAGARRILAAGAAEAAAAAPG